MRHVRVALGETEFVALDPSDARWNGFVAAPYFDVSEANRVIAYVNSLHGPDAQDGERLRWDRWDGDVVVCTDLETGSEERWEYVSGFGWPIGAYGWCWYLLGDD